ncbi:MFS transporter [Salinibacterium hongtaonis]|uniref:MFS transporter n=1 Tax=Homoserinimonas hongtaonis TaxID=2079791 RepID=UPI000D35E2F4|nr:MFS transporter [Salinibacterium hongtaonis]AWB88378.1 MFS transporter [Salinibacterium hongtaonis]
MSAPQTRTPLPPFPYLALFTVAVATFLSVTIEMLPTGLLPEMSDELGVTESMIGLTVSVFAFTVVLSSALLSHLTRRFDRHKLVVIVLLVLAASTVLTAFAPNYGVLIASRVLGGLAHGLFWAVMGAYASYLVPKEQLGRAVSISLGGGSLAFVFGVPLGVTLGHAVGWRMAFLVLAGLALVGTFFVYKFLPPVKAGAITPTMSIAVASSTSTGSVTVLADSTHAPRREQSVLAVVIVCLITAVTMIGQYTFYTYITPFLERSVGVSKDFISPALFGYGVMGLLSLVIVAAWLGSRPRLGLIIALVTVFVSVLTLAVWPGFLWLGIIAFLMWGLAGGMLPPLLQTRVLRAAPARIRDVSSAFYTTAFNSGIGGGALVGALALEHWGLGVLPYIHAAFLVVAILLVIVADVVLHGVKQRRVIEH